MKIVKPSFEILDEIDGHRMLKKIERAGRTCYQSFDRTSFDSHMRFAQMLIDSGHESVLEHEKVTVRIVCDRGVSHELVRHRIASFSQESTRYCNYGGKDIEYIEPCYLVNKSLSDYLVWYNGCKHSEDSYNSMISMGRLPQECRAILPNSLKTEIVVTANLREWRTILKQRCSAKAHPQFREISIPLLLAFRQLVPVVFDDIEYDTKFEYGCAEWIKKESA